jgi:hypothetical protein
MVRRQRYERNPEATRTIQEEEQRKWFITCIFSNGKYSVD